MDQLLTNEYILVIGQPFLLKLRGVDLEVARDGVGRERTLYEQSIV
jgi:hypothetical protein